MLKTYKLYGGKEKIEFDDTRHLFYDGKGNYLTSVTGATGIVDKSRPLIYWAVGLSLDYLRNKWLGNKEAPIITEEDFIIAGKQHTIKKETAATIGDLIHQWVSEWIKGKKPGMPEDEKVVNGITAFLKFQKEHKVKWLESERIIYSRKNNYAGIADAIGIIDGKTELIDFKSSNSLYSEMRFQVSGYALAYNEEMGKKIDRRRIIRFGKNDGEFESIILDDDKKDEKAFLACLAIKNRLKEIGNGK